MKDNKDEWKIDDSFVAPPVRNADNAWLGPMGGVIGHVSEVNGASAQECPEFHPTRHELIVLAKYWAEIAIDIEYWWFRYEQFGSDETRRHAFGWRRVGRIRGLLGEEVDKAIDEVYERFAAKENKEAWEIFLHGSEAERAALQDKIQRSIASPRRRLVTKLRCWTRKFRVRWRRD